MTQGHLFARVSADTGEKKPFVTIKHHTGLRSCPQHMVPKPMGCWGMLCCSVTPGSHPVSLLNGCPTPRVEPRTSESLWLHSHGSMGKDTRKPRGWAEIGRFSLFMARTRKTDHFLNAAGIGTSLPKSTVKEDESPSCQLIPGLENNQLERRRSRHAECRQGVESSH